MEICEICDSEQPEELIAIHFERCFKDHCPVEAVAVEPRPRVAQEALLEEWLGSRRLPPCAAESLFRHAMPPLSLMAFACTSRCGRKAIDKLDLWENHLSTMWIALWSQIGGASPLDLACSCSFASPNQRKLSELKRNACLLWSASKVGSVRFLVKTLTGKILDIPIEGALDGFGNQMPVLLHATVLHLKTLFMFAEGPPPHEIRLVLNGSRQLLHEPAPLAAYVWDHIQNKCSASLQPIRLDSVLRMSTRTCNMSLGAPASTDEFSFMGNFRVPATDDSNRKWWT